jgi:hypothetical protein
MKKFMNLLVLCFAMSALTGCYKKDDKAKQPKKEQKAKAKKKPMKKSMKKSDKKMKSPAKMKKEDKGY